MDLIHNNFPPETATLRTGLGEESIYSVKVQGKIRVKMYMRKVLRRLQGSFSSRPFRVFA